jgi:hypothetical protein
MQRLHIRAYEAPHMWRALHISKKKNLFIVFGNMNGHAVVRVALTIEDLISAREVVVAAIKQ